VPALWWAASTINPLKANIMTIKKIYEVIEETYDPDSRTWDECWRERFGELELAEEYIRNLLEQLGHDFNDGVGHYDKETWCATFKFKDGIENLYTIQEVNLHVR
jgi:hypothetical protein